MILQFYKDLLDLLRFIKSHKKYISSRSAKDRIIAFYESFWLPHSLDFKKKYGEKKHLIIQTALSNSYKYAKKDHVEKNKLIQELQKVEPVLEEIKHEYLINYGYIIQHDTKTEVISDLKSKNFVGTLKYLNEAENEFQLGKWKPSCFNSRLALEEYLREFRQKVFKKQIKVGTVSDHVAELKSHLGLELGEIQLIKNGLYAFLSNKGGHATTDRPSEEDANLAITLNYIFIGYFFDKFERFLV